MAAPVIRRVCSLLLSLVMALLVVGGAAGTAHAADGYRYWNYSHLKAGSWETSKVGADGYQPKDGAVEGYRYGTSTVAQGIAPRAGLDKVTFDAICAATKEAAGKKRVGVVLDFGTKADAEGDTPPPAKAECAVVDTKANGQQVLQAVAQVRTGAVPTCAIDGYPAQGCGVPVKNAKVPSDEPTVAVNLPPTKAAQGTAAGSKATNKSATDQTDQGSGVLWPVVGVVVLVALIGAGAFAMNRRNQTSA